MEVLEPKLCAFLASFMSYLPTLFQHFLFAFFFLTILHLLRKLQAAYGLKRQDERIVRATQNKAATHFRKYTRHWPACKN